MERISTRKSIGLGCLLGVLTSVVVIGVTYAADQLAGLAFPPFTLFDFMARVLPGALITAMIDLMVSAIAALNLGPTADMAKLVEQTLALAQFGVLGALLGGVLGALRGRTGPALLRTYGLVLGLLLAAVFAAIQAQLGFPAAGAVASLIWLAIVLGGWGLALSWMLRGTARSEKSVPYAAGLTRREALSIGGTTLAAAIASVVGLGFAVSAREPAQGAQAAPTPAGSLTGGAASSPSADSLEARIDPAPGTRPEITPTGDFYRIDINTRPPAIAETDWQLEIAGLVDNPMTLSLEQIRQRPSVSQYITLSCISNRIGGDLISTALWTGFRLKDLLDEAGLQSDAQSLQIEAEDGFFETVVMEDLMDERTLLVYEMNGEPLPQEHGFPLRIYIPNRYGMKQPKWIVRMTVVAGEPEGYWVERGWSRTANMRTTSVIDAAAAETADNGQTVMGGIAHAGERGISMVEVQVDDGSWQEAELRIPPISPLTWVQWRYEDAYAPGSHTARVRAKDGNGELQVLEDSPPHPDGATGIHSFSFDV